MPDNENNPEVIGESIPMPAENAVAEVDPQYEAQILLSVKESNTSIMKTPEERAEIAALEQEVGAVVSGTVAESSGATSPEEQKRQETIGGAESLEGRKFSFPGISERYNATLKAERDECAEYFTITWDDLMLKFQSQGFKVHVGKNKEIYILPGDSDDIENDGIMPRHLEISDEMDEELKELIRQNQK